MVTKDHVGQYCALFVLVVGPVAEDVIDDITVRFLAQSGQTKHCNVFLGGDINMSSRRSCNYICQCQDPVEGK